jgi:hypothetical protein
MKKNLMINFLQLLSRNTQLAEWSNAPDLRSGSFGSVGSNPTLCIGDLSPLVLLAQRIARETSNLEVVGSNPT